MARDVGDLIGNALGSITREAAQSLLDSVSSRNEIRPEEDLAERSTFGLTRGAGGRGARGGHPTVAAKGAGKLVSGAVTKRFSSSGSNGEKQAQGLKDTLGKGVKDTVGKKIDEAGGASGIVPEAGKGVLPGSGGGDSKSKKGTPGVGKGRRMPIQQSVDIGVPLSTAYNQFTQFEEWPQFMHRLEQATQEDDCTVWLRPRSGPSRRSSRPPS